MDLRGRRIYNFIDFSLKACSREMGIWLLTLIFHTSVKGRPPQPLKERVPNIIENWILNDQSHKKRWLRPRKTQYLKHLHFWPFWFHRGCWGHHDWWSQWGHWFTLELELSYLKAKVILFWCFENIICLVESWNFKCNFDILLTWGCVGQAMSFM